MPNTTRCIHPDGTVRLQAVRDLAPGEEILTSYIDADGLGSVQRRRQALEAKYAFVCCCSRCVREAGESGCVQ